MITLSGLQHVAACPGSASLPRQPRTSLPALLGHAIHELAETRIRCVDEGPDDGGMLADNIASARGLSADDAGRLSLLARHLRLPIPAGALAEVPLGYWPDGSVRRATGGAGEYANEGQILSGTLDGIWAEPAPIERVQVMQGHGPECFEMWCQPGSTLWIYDLKTGDDDHVPPIDRNWQLRAGALLAARWTGAQRVIPAICYVNAAECAAWLREHPGEPYEGRWECGAPLDVAALDAIEVELRAVLARARGGSDGLGEDVTGGGAAAAGRQDVGRGDRSAQGVAPLILGPHCEHCPARGACPAIAAEALTLARGEGLYLPPGGALTRDAASRLAGLLSPARRVLDAVEEALKAHAQAHGPIPLADGREWGPVLEPVTRYKTAPTFEALAAMVGDERANEAFTTSTTALREAVAEQGRGAWKRLQEDIEARGGVVPGAREVWRKRWPAKPAEAMTDEQAEQRYEEAVETGAERQEPEAVGEGAADWLHATHVASGEGTAPQHVPEVPGPHPPARAPCSVCGRVYAVTKYNRVRAHSRPGGGLYCDGGGASPAQTTIPGAA